jgi:hypothetical protein
MLWMIFYVLLASLPLCCGLYFRRKNAKDGPKVGKAVFPNSWLAIFGGCFGKCPDRVFIIFAKDCPKVGKAVLPNSWLDVFGGCFG